MYRKTAIIMALLLLLSALSLPALAAEPGPIRVVVTSFPLFDWTRQVLGERGEAVSLHLLQDAGIDLHNFQPTVEDMVQVSSADVFIYIGGPSDRWVADALKEAVNPRQIPLNLMDALGDHVKQDLTVEGMQESDHHHDHDHDHDDHDHEHDEDHNHDHDHEDAQPVARVHSHADEHIWLSLRNAQVLVAAIRDALMEADPDHRETYTANAAAYIEQLKNLDAQYSQLLDTKEQKVLLFGDRFPFRYLMDDYGITYYAAFAGCSAETEASFETIAFLSGKVDSLSLKAVMKLDGSDGRIADAVVRTTDSRSQAVMTLNAMQSVSREDIESDASYLAIMEDNLAVLNQAL